MNIGYEPCEKTELALWEQYRHEFPVTENLIYLNHAAVAPLSRRAAGALKALADDALLTGSHHYDKWLETYAGLRSAAARLIGAAPQEIAIVKNTSEGISMVATGLQWRPGDKVVTFVEEFPANYLPWSNLEKRGIQVERLSIADPLDRLDAACRGARLLAVSFVQYLSGFRADLTALGEICRRRDCLFLVDAIQGLGAFPVDVRTAGIHFLAADGHKWLLGPEGCGVLYVNQNVQDLVTPVEFGWTNVARYGDYSARDLALRPDAGRYECGTLNTIGCYGLRAAIDFLLELGMDSIAPAVQAVADQIAAGVTAKGYQVLGNRTPSSGAGIVTFRRSDLHSEALSRDLRLRRIEVASRQGWVRASPHFYISPQQIENFLELLP